MFWRSFSVGLIRVFTVCLQNIQSCCIGIKYKTVNPMIRNGFVKIIRNETSIHLKWDKTSSVQQPMLPKNVKIEMENYDVHVYIISTSSITVHSSEFSSACDAVRINRPIRAFAVHIQRNQAPNVIERVSCSTQLSMNCNCL